MYPFTCGITAPCKMQMVASTYKPFTIFESLKIFRKSLVEWSGTTKGIVCFTKTSVIKTSVRITESSLCLYKVSTMFILSWLTKSLTKCGAIGKYVSNDPLIYFHFRLSVYSVFFHLVLYCVIFSGNILSKLVFNADK